MLLQYLQRQTDDKLNLYYGYFIAFVNQYFSLNTIIILLNERLTF